MPEIITMEPAAVWTILMFAFGVLVAYHFVRVTRDCVQVWHENRSVQSLERNLDFVRSLPVPPEGDRGEAAFLIERRYG